MGLESKSPAAATPLAMKLRAVHVGLREDLEVTRHLFRGEPSYAIRDPLTFQCQQLTPEDYDIVIRLTAAKPLSAVFDQLVRDGKVSAEDEEEFYHFILNLHRLGFLRLPMSDDKQLYKRFVAKQAAKKKEKLMGFMFLRIPLVNPDAFLNRTVHLVRPLFSRTAFVLWLVLMIGAAYVGFSQRAELAKPLDGLLASRNLPLMWITLIVLKLFHELGHAYACKHYGGHVPEMGAYLVMFTPCAYVDATACWGFNRKWERLVVCFGGMYVESIFAAIAVLVWSVTEPSLIRSLAYNVIFLAGTITVLFNINPLMRYDGYYILSDLTEVPNLRARASQFFINLLKRKCLGLPVPAEAGNGRLKSLLFVYGAAAAVYRVTLVLGIAALIATKFFVLGLSLAAFYITNAVIGFIMRMSKYLWQSQETASIRWRALAISAALFLVFPAVALFAPLPASVRATGVIGATEEFVIRAPSDGFLQEIAIEPGQPVEQSQPLARLASESVDASVATSQAALRAAQIREDAMRVHDPGGVLMEHDRVVAAEVQLQHAKDEEKKLSIRAPQAGVVVGSLRPRDVGSYVHEGAPISTIAAGDWRVRAILTQDQAAASKPQVGQVVEFRATADPAQTVRGKISHLSPAGSRRVSHPSLTQLGGGDIIIDPQTHEASQPFFEIAIDIPHHQAEHFQHGMTGVARLPAEPEPLAKRLKRRVERFVNKLLQHS